MKKGEKTHSQFGGWPTASNFTVCSNLDFASFEKLVFSIAPWILALSLFTSRNSLMVNS